MMGFPSTTDAGCVLADQIGLHIHSSIIINLYIESTDVVGYIVLHSEGIAGVPDKLNHFGNE
jgi:hypothetical protein